MISLPPEKLGSFYLGAEYNLDSGKLSDEVINYDARDLTTHAVCVGMTGSGKTGLCIGLLEEAAIDQVPAIIIDPKGDMTNLMLQFENLAPEDFKQWINDGDASRKGLTVDEYATKIARTWEEGLNTWGQGKDRIRDLGQSVDYTIFTPGSNAGMPINILGSFAAPKVDFDDDPEMMFEKIQGISAALLGMIGSKEDPVKSREGILLANIFEHYWRNGEDLDIAKVIMAIQKPPVTKLGVFDIETFYPSKERFELAMEFNTLVASPQFRYWLEGEPLDIQKLYFTSEGKPRHSIIYIAHLSESERMFFVTLLLNSLITWMRSQSGTTSLRSLLYFDEIFGYFPPTANPPSKKPLLTILKQARAYGVGAVLVTQNPVDIDYKGLSNAGTWFIGKLQTERDKERVKDGLEGAIAEAGGNSEMDFDKIISQLDSRVFLLHNVHAGEPVIFNTRWVMSYLRGPLTKPQIKGLMATKKSDLQKTEDIPFEITNADSTTSTLKSQSDISAGPPSMAPGINQRFLIPRDGSGTLHYRPVVFAIGKVRFNDNSKGIDIIKNYNMLCPAPDDFGRINWEVAKQLADWETKLRAEPVDIQAVETRYADIPETMNSSKMLKQVEGEFANYLYTEKRHSVLNHPKLKLTQQTGQDDSSFKAEVNHRIKEIRDQKIDDLKDKYEAKFDKINEKIRKEERDYDEARADLRGRRTDELMNVGGLLVSILGGRSRSLSTAATKRRMARKAREKLAESQEDIEVLNMQYADLEQELNEKINKLRTEWQVIEEGIEEKLIKPTKANIKVDEVLIAWIPKWV